MRAARELSVNQTLIKRDGIRPATGMWGVGRDLNRVLVSVMMLLLHERRERGLLNKTLRGATTEIQDTRHARVSHDIHHVQHVMNEIEHEVVVLYKTSPGDTECETTVDNCRTEDRY